MDDHVGCGLVVSGFGRLRPLAVCGFGSLGRVSGGFAGECGCVALVRARAGAVGLAKHLPGFLGGVWHENGGPRGSPPSSFVSLYVDSRHIGSHHVVPEPPLEEAFWGRAVLAW